MPLKRKTPCFLASDYRGKTKKGLDGLPWLSKKMKNGTYRWTRSPATNTCVKKGPKIYKCRPSPSFPAKDMKGGRAHGNDGEMWLSIPDRNGIYTWRRSGKITVASYISPPVRPFNIPPREQPLTIRPSIIDTPPVRLLNIPPPVSRRPSIIGTSTVSELQSRRSSIDSLPSNLSRQSSVQVTSTILPAMPEYDERIRQMMSRLLKMIHPLTLEEFRAGIKKADNEKNHDWINAAHNLITTPLFLEAVEWDDVRAFYYLFIQGLLPSVPTHGGPLLLDSQAEIKVLSDVNKLGALTVDSQPGVCTLNLYQRAYVEFFVNETQFDIQKLFDSLSKNDEYLVTVCTQNKDTMTNVPRIINTWTRLPIEKVVDKVQDGETYYDQISRTVPADNVYYGNVKDIDAYFVFTAAKDRSDDLWSIGSTPHFNHDRTIQIDHTRKYVDLNGSFRLTFISICDIRFCKSNLLGHVAWALMQAGK